MENFIKPWNYTLNGSMDVLFDSEEFLFLSEENEDEYKKVVVGTMVIINNIIYLNGISKNTPEKFNRYVRLKKKEIEGLRSLRTEYNFYDGYDDSDEEGDF
jgi:hypothetical protein